MTTETQVRTSRIGKRPVALPKGVSVALSSGTMEVKGPKGALSRSVPSQVSVKIENDQAFVSAQAPGSNAARLQGTARAHLNNMVIGVSQGYTRILKLEGTGYRAELKGKFVHLALGLSHPVHFELPETVSASIPGDSKGTVLILTGIDKDLIGQTAAKIRSFRPPEPYGGKGVRFENEVVRRKAGKTGGKGGKK